MGRRKTYFRTDPQERGRSIGRLNARQQRNLARVAMTNMEQANVLESYVGKPCQLKGTYKFFTFEGSPTQCYPQESENGERHDSLIPDVYVVNGLEAIGTKEARRILVSLSPRTNPSNITYFADMNELDEAFDPEIIATRELRHPTIDDVDIWGSQSGRPPGITSD